MVTSLSGSEPSSITTAVVISSAPNTDSRQWVSSAPLP